MSIFLVDSYKEANHDGVTILKGSPITGVAHSFTGKAGDLTQAKFYLKKVGSPTGNVTAVLYAHSGTFGTSSIPTGTALATSDNIDISTIGTSYELITFTFSGAEQYTLIDDIKYCIAIKY